MKKEIKKFQETEVAKLIGGVVVRGLSSVIAIILVAIIFWAVWFYKTESDVLYLIAVYVMFGSMIDMCIIMFTSECIQKYWNKGINKIRRRSRIMKLKLEKESKDSEEE